MCVAKTNPFTAGISNTLHSLECILSHKVQIGYMYMAGIHENNLSAC